MNSSQLSLEQAEELVEKLFRLDPLNSTRYDYRLLLSKLIPRNIFKVNNYPEGQLYYRVVYRLDLPLIVSQISYNPIIDFNNRGALENEPVFYCSNDIKTALLETALQVGSKYIIGEWINTERFNIAPIGFKFSDFPILDRMTPVYFGDSRSFKEENSTFDDVSNFVHDTIVKIFLLERNDKNIKLINYTAEYNYQSTVVAEAFAYPPVNKATSGYNYSMLTSLINNKIITCSYAIEIEILEIGDEIKYNILNFASIERDSEAIDWQPVNMVSSYSTGRQIYFHRDDFGVPGAYDENGDLLF